MTLSVSRKQGRLDWEICVAVLGCSSTKPRAQAVHGRFTEIRSLAAEDRAL